MANKNASNSNSTNRSVNLSKTNNNANSFKNSNANKNNLSNSLRNNSRNNFSNKSNNFSNRSNNLSNLSNKSSNLNNLNKSSNKSSKSNNSSNNSSSIFMIIAVILLLVVLAVSGYFLYKYMKKEKRGKEKTKQFIPYIHDATIDKRISYGSIPVSSQSNEYNINFWIYVNDYAYRKEHDKCIIYKGDWNESYTAPKEATEQMDSGKCNPGVWLLKGENTFRVVIGLETKYGKKECNPSKQSEDCDEALEDVHVCDIEHFPLQKWVCVNISLRSNVLDIFFDGKLKKSCILAGSPYTGKDDMHICPTGSVGAAGTGFNGYLSNMKYTNMAISVEKIEAMYKKGPTL